VWLRADSGSYYREIIVSFQRRSDDRDSENGLPVEKLKGGRAAIARKGGEGNTSEGFPTEGEEKKETLREKSTRSSFGRGGIASPFLREGKDVFRKAMRKGTDLLP